MSMYGTFAMFSTIFFFPSPIRLLIRSRRELLPSPRMMRPFKATRETSPICLFDMVKSMLHLKATIRTFSGRRWWSTNPSGHQRHCSDANKKKRNCTQNIVEEMKRFWHLARLSPRQEMITGRLPQNCAVWNTFGASKSGPVEGAAGYRGKGGSFSEGSLYSVVPVCLQICP